MLHFIRNGESVAKIIAQNAKLKFLDFFHDKKRRTITGASAGVVFLSIFIAVLLVEKPSNVDRPEAFDRLAGNRASGSSASAIPVEEIFLPEEPDFVPGVLLERERRAIWTEDDAAEYWQDPLKYGEEQWREKIEAVIDDYMERVP